jgi:hypothetical protein
MPKLNRLEEFVSKAERLGLDRSIGPDALRCVIAAACNAPWLTAEERIKAQALVFRLDRILSRLKHQHLHVDARGSSDASCSRACSIGLTHSPG